MVCLGFQCLIIWMMKIRQIWILVMEDGRVTVEKTEGGDEVVLTLPEDAPALAVGDVITAYTTGISTMSLPPQMNAIAIVK